MILILLSSLLLAQDHCANNNWIDPDYSKLETSINKKIAESSHLVTIAREADSVLSKLITAKSSILMNWLEKRNLLSQKEEKIAQEWRKYYLENFILSKYPTPNPKINVSVEKIFKDVNQLSFNEDYKNKISKIFSSVQKDSIKLINSWSIDLKTKKEIVTKISDTKIYWFKKLKGSKYQNIPLEFLKWGVAYDPVTNEINIGVQTKKYAHDSTLYSVLAHELGHAFDPCRWSAFFKQPNPFKELYTCLRSKESTGAEKRDDAKMKEMIQKKYLSQDMATSLNNNPTCNRTFYPPLGTQKEQLLEVFADWFAAEVIAESSYLDKNMRSDLCEKKQTKKGSSYLSHQARLNKIYFAQPKIKKFLKQNSTAKHCSLL